MRFIGQALIFLSLCSVLTGCLEYKVHEVKDFRVFVETDEPKLQSAIEALAKRFNKDVGTKTLTIVKDRSQSNSTISFVRNLNNNDGHKLGLGQWTTSQREQNTMATQGPRKSIIINYGMQIEFDFDNFASRANMVDDISSNEFQHLYHLFCHEVGHGMQMDHAELKSNVMYPSIPETTVRPIDYKAYFSGVRSFMGVIGKSETTLTVDNGNR
jgi:hypothetical protein